MEFLDTVLSGLRSSIPAAVAVVLVVILALPVSEQIRGQLIGLIGIIVGAAIALSATTMMGNVLAAAIEREASTNDDP